MEIELQYNKIIIIQILNMHLWLIFGSILLGLTAAQSVAYYPPFGTCSYTGDPHLIPFPTTPGQVTNMYFCSTIGWQILLQNQWIFIAVKVGPSPFVILDVSIISHFHQSIDFFHLSMSSSSTKLIKVLPVY
jgi:hypothetical protein